MQAAIEAYHSGTWKQTALVCLEQNLLSGYCHMSPRSTTISFYDAQYLPWRLPKKHSNASCIRKNYMYSGWSIELTWQHLLSEFHSKQTRAVCVNQFHHSLEASMAICQPVSLRHSRNTNCYLVQSLASNLLRVTCNDVTIPAALVAHSSLIYTHPFNMLTCVTHFRGKCWQ